MAEAFLTQYPYLKTVRDLAGKKKVPVYLVGGFLRDHLLGQTKQDFDFAVERGAVAMARLCARRMKGAFVLLDQEHGCGRVVKKDSRGLWTFDFADYRARGITADLRHRDFTVNTLTVRMNTLKDPQRLDDIIEDRLKILPDLKRKRVRMVSPGAFAEDPLRLMRAYSLKAQWGMAIEAKTKAAIKKQARLLQRVSMERVRDEFFKILASPRAFSVMAEMEKAGLLEEVLPQITVMYGVKQGGYHHLDVWRHSMETVRQLEMVLEEMGQRQELREYLNEPVAGQRPRYALLKLAALLHDIGKPDTRRREKDRLTFHGHEHVGRSITRLAARRLKLSVRERHALEDMVRWHLRPGYLSNFRKPTDKAVFRYFRDTKQEAASIAILSMADQRSTCGELTTEKDQEHHDRICRGLLVKFFERKKERPPARLIDGHDLIRELKLKPSPLFGEILMAVEEHQATGRITSRTEALDLARKLAVSRSKP